MTTARTVNATFALSTGLKVTRLTADKANPQPVGTTVTFTAAASGGTGPYEYRWVHYNGSKWAVGQEWSTSNTFTWTPTVAADHCIQVFVRSAGSTSANTPKVWKGQHFLVTTGP
jgi:cell wall-associated protease